MKGEKNSIDWSKTVKRKTLQSRRNWERQEKSRNDRLHEKKADEIEHLMEKLRQYVQNLENNSKDIEPKKDSLKESTFI